VVESNPSGGGSPALDEIQSEPAFRGLPIAATGHRPDKLGGYSPKTMGDLSHFAGAVLDVLKPEYAIVGMAQGWDQAVASACYIMGISFDAYVPFEGQESKWPKEARDHYTTLLAKARRVRVCNFGGYAPWKMHDRNQEMVDAISRAKGYVLALWDGENVGGTAACIRYARQEEASILNVWHNWVSWAKRNP
jgi:hypothetical protein